MCTKAQGWAEARRGQWVQADETGIGHWPGSRPSFAGSGPWPGCAARRRPTTTSPKPPNDLSHHYRRAGASSPAAPDLSRGPAQPPRAGPRAVRVRSGPHPAGQHHVLDRRKTTRTASPISMVAGSISLIGPSAVDTRFPTIADRRVLVERDDDHVVRGELAVGGEQRRVRHHERPHRPPPRGRDPAHRQRPAVRAHRPGREPPPSTSAAFLDQQLAAPRAGPELGGVLALEVGQQRIRSPRARPPSSEAAARWSARPRRWSRGRCRPRRPGWSRCRASGGPLRGSG